MNFNKSTNVVIITPLPEEHDEFLQVLPNLRDLSEKNRVVTLHDSGLPDYNIISILPVGMGQDDAYDAAMEAIDRFSPDMIICVGIAGALDSDLKIGDVAVSQEIIDISQNMKIADGKKGAGSKIQLSPRALPIDEIISAGCRFVRSHPNLKPKYEAWKSLAMVRRKELEEDLVSSGIGHELEIEPDVFTGAIVSGPVVASKEFKETLKALDRKVIAIETEAAGIYRACSKHQIPFVTIRGISDHADLTKNALERTSKLSLRKLAAKNACEYVKIQLSNPSFLRSATYHASFRRYGKGPLAAQNSAVKILEEVKDNLHSYLSDMSPEYKHRPNGTTLPIPRVIRALNEENLFEDDDERKPISVGAALTRDNRFFLKIPKSYPNQTLAWSIGQSLIKTQILGKTVLPLVIDGSEITPPSKGFMHAFTFNFLEDTVIRDFHPVLIINEPHVWSKGKISYLISQLEDFDNVSAIIISRADSPVEEIDRLKSSGKMVEYETSPVPFSEIALYLEGAFEMEPAEADAVANRLDSTFSKFRMHAHPAYFVGLHEETLSAFIDANQRSELIQLAVSGILTFAVLFDRSEIKVSRSFREEFLSQLVLEIKCYKRSFTREDLVTLSKNMADERSLEIDAYEFIRAFFAVGLMVDFDGQISFSVPYVEAYLLARRLISEPAEALVYFDPILDSFDFFSFDIYSEIGPSDEVIKQLLEYADLSLAHCDDEKHIYSQKMVSPRALKSNSALMNLTTDLSKVAKRIADTSNDEDTRAEKQKLIDARARVTSTVGKTRDKRDPNMPPEKKAEFDRMDRLSRSTTLLATLLGSGSERLRTDQKNHAADRLMKVFDRFSHYWTKNRLEMDFDQLRKELLSDQSIEQLISDLEGIEVDRADIIHSLSVFIDDQELRAIGGPLNSLLSRLSHYAGVRSLKPVFEKLEISGEVQAIARDVLMMDIEHRIGRKKLKASLSQYRGSDFLRLIVANHLVMRVYWHHWKKESRVDFMDVADYALKPMRLITSESHKKMALHAKDKP